MQTGWNDCPEPVREQVLQFCAALQETLSDNLTGIYLHGSLAMGCFNPQLSDIDLLVVIGKTMSVETKHKIANLILHSSNQPRPIEITFVLYEALLTHVFPMAFDFHYSEDWRERMQEQLADDSWK